MKCFYCQHQINEAKLDWGYMLFEELVQFAHFKCVEYDKEMERIETEEYLASILTF